MEPFKLSEYAEWRGKGYQWTEDEIEYFERAINTVADFAALRKVFPHRSDYALRVKLRDYPKHKLKLHTWVEWKAREIEVLKTFGSVELLEDLHKRLQRHSIRGIEAKLKKLEIEPKKSTWISWTPTELAIMKSSCLYKFSGVRRTKPIRQVLAELHGLIPRHSASAIYEKIRILNLKELPNGQAHNGGAEEAAGKRFRWPGSELSDAGQEPCGERESACRANGQERQTQRECQG